MMCMCMPVKVTQSAYAGPLWLRWPHSNKGSFKHHSFWRYLLVNIVVHSGHYIHLLWCVCMLHATIHLFAILVALTTCYDVYKWLLYPLVMMQKHGYSIHFLLCVWMATIFVWQIIVPLFLFETSELTFQNKCL